MNLYENLVRKADESIGLFHRELIALNDDIAEHPEIGGAEFRDCGRYDAAFEKQRICRGISLCRS